MKSVAILALVAGASATFKGANPFTCPSNTDNKCEDKQKPGFNWFDLPPGPFDNYDKFKFHGWQCSEDKNFKRRGQFDRRTPNKVIGGTCFSEKPKCPSFGSPDKFSLDKIHVSTEFDCDLEFHYDMPDGSLCRHRAPCKKGGSQIKNTQCGGAKNVTIIYPPQPNKPKPQCGITVTSIDFDCGPPKTTATRPPTSSTSLPVTTTSTAPGTTVTSTAPGTTRTSTAPGTTVTSTAPGTTVTSSGASTTVTSTAPGTTLTTTAPGTTFTSTAPGTTFTSTAPGTTLTSTAPGTTVTSSAPGTTVTSSAPATTTSTVTTVFPSTSTVFTTSVSTIVSCGGNKPECPGQSSTTVITVTVPVSTTVCDVTETKTVSSTIFVSTPSGTTVTTTSTKPAGPIETLPCPDVVPQCLNTWIFQLGCKDNTDTSCYCPDATFAKNVFECFYAHGASDADISRAVTFYQGICAPHIPQNPAIVTAPTVTSYITVTAPPTSTNPAAITTIVVSTTTVLPVTDSNGSTVPSSSTTVTINTSVTVPKLGFTTGTDAASTSIVGLVPITTPISAVAPTTTAPAGTGATPPTTTGPASTGGVVTPPKPGQTTPVVVAGSGRVQVGAAGLAGLAAVVVAALL